MFVGSTNPYIAPSLAALFAHRAPPAAHEDRKEPPPAAVAAAAGAGELAPVMVAMQRLRLESQLDTLPEQLSSIAEALIEYDPTAMLLDGYLNSLQERLHLPNGQDVRVLLFKKNSQLIAKLFKAMSKHGGCDLLHIPPKIQAVFLLPEVGHTLAELDLEIEILPLKMLFELFPNVQKLHVKNDVTMASLAKLPVLEDLEVGGFVAPNEAVALHALKSLTVGDGRHLPETIALLKGCQQLRALKFCRVNFGQEAAPNGILLPQVTHLTLDRSTNMTGAKLAQFFPALTHLRHDRMHEEAGWELLPKLRSLTATGSVQALKAAVSTNPQLQHLDYTNWQTSLDDAMEAISSLRELTDLRLEFTRGDLDQKKARALLKNHPKLQEATLSLYPRDITDDVIAALKLLPRVIVTTAGALSKEEQERFARELPHVIFRDTHPQALPKKSADDHYRALQTAVGSHPLVDVLKGNFELLHSLLTRYQPGETVRPEFLTAALRGAGGALRVLKFSHFSNEEFQRVAAFVPEVRELHTEIPRASQEQLAGIAKRFPKLEKLQIVSKSSLPYTYEGDYTALSGLQHLRAVVFEDYKNVDRPTFASLVTAQPHLTAFTMAYPICEERLMHVARLQSLKELSVSPARISLDEEAFFKIIGKQFTKLERLAVFATLTEKVVPFLAPLTALTALERVTIVDPKVVEALARQHPNLNELQLMNRPEAAVIAALIHLQKLRKLTLQDDVALDALQRACPGLEELHFAGQNEYVLTTEEAETLLQFAKLKVVRGVRIYDYRADKATKARCLTLLTNLEKKGCRIYGK